MSKNAKVITLGDVSDQINEQRRALLLLTRTLPFCDEDPLDKPEQMALRSLLEGVAESLAVIEAKIDDGNDGL